MYLEAVLKLQLPINLKKDNEKCLKNLADLIHGLNVLKMKKILKDVQSLQDIKKVGKEYFSQNKTKISSSLKWPTFKVKKILSQIISV